MVERNVFEFHPILTVRECAHDMPSALLAFSYFDLVASVAILVFIVVVVLRIHFRRGATRCSSSGSRRESAARSLRSKGRSPSSRPVKDFFGSRKQTRPAAVVQVSAAAPDPRTGGLRPGHIRHQRAPGRTGEERQSAPPAVRQFLGHPQAGALLRGLRIALALRSAGRRREVCEVVFFGPRQPPHDV